MKKTILTVALLSTAAVAKTALGAKAIVATVGITVAGVVLLPGLVVGDAQWQALTNEGKCDVDHAIYTVAPMFGDKQPGKIKVVVPCSEWFELNR